MNVGLIGYGYWGHKYLRALMNTSANTMWACSRNSANIKQDLPAATRFTNDYHEILNDKNVDCVIIATPADTHFQIARDSLSAGKHVLVEKPFISNSIDAEKLIQLTCDKLVLMVGHIYLHHNGIIKLKELIDGGTLGEITSVYSKRMSLSKYPNALWEMGTHDLYILEYFFDKYVAEETRAMGDTTHCIFNMQYTKVLYEPYIREHKINAYIEVDSDYPDKIRTIVINGTKKRVTFDDEANANVKITVADRATKEVEFISINQDISPLEKQCLHFFDCIKKHEKPMAGAFEGFKNIRSLELINKLL